MMTTPATFNHYPLFGRKVPGSCNDTVGTADPFAAITCPACRARLAHKIASDSANALVTRDQQLATMQTSTSRYYAAVLAA